MGARKTIGWACAAVASAAVWLFPGHAPAAENPNFNITDRASFDAFKGAVRAAEQVRDIYATGSWPRVTSEGAYLGERSNPPGTKPRVVALTAAYMAFAERNPGANDGALRAFINAYDTELLLFSTTDPDLTRPANLLAALRFTRVVGGTDSLAGEVAALRGYDTNIGERAMELLGIELPDGDSRQSIEDRVSAYNRAIINRFGTRPEWGLLLVQATLNRTRDGTPHAANIAQPLREYLSDEDYPALNRLPQPEFVRLDTTLDLIRWADVRDAIGDAKSPVVTTGNETLQELADIEVANIIQRKLRKSVFNAFDRGTTLTNQVTNLPEVTLEEGLLLTQPEIDEINRVYFEDLRNTSAERAALLFNAGLMYESVDGVDYAETQLDLGSAIIGRNNRWIRAKAGVTAGFAIAGIGASIAQGKDGLTSGIGFAQDGVLAAMEFGETYDAGVTVDDIYDQVQQMRVQLVDMQTQLNQRFDRVDQKLDVIFDTMISQWALLDADLTIIKDALQTILRQTTSVYRLDATIEEVGTAIIGSMFNLQANDLLGVRERVPGPSGDFPLNSDGSRSFDAQARGFFTYATSNAAAFTGDASNPFDIADADLEVNPATGDGGVGGGDAVSSKLNDLIGIAKAEFLTTAEAALLPDSVVGPEPWAIAATAYTQLAAESPWYWAKRNAPEEIGGIIDDGEDLIALSVALRQTASVDNGSGGTRLEPVLFAALHASYKAATQNLQNAIDAAIFDELATGSNVILANATEAVDPWGTGLQDLPTLATRLHEWTTTWGNANDRLDLPNNADLGGYLSLTGNMFRSNGDAEPNRARRMALQTLLLADSTGGDFRQAYWFNSNSTGNRYEFTVEMYRTPGLRGGVTEQRTIEYRRQIKTISTSDWTASPPDNNNDAADFIKRIWGLMKHDIASGDRLVGNTYTQTFVGPIQERLVVTGDFSSGSASFNHQRDIAEALRDLRSRVRDTILEDQLKAGTGAVYDAALALNDIEALMDAYVSIAFPEAIDSSVILRSALRGPDPDYFQNQPGSQYGLRSGDVEYMMELFIDADQPVTHESGDFNEEAWGDRTFDLPAVKEILDTRADQVYEEIVAAVNAPIANAPYVEWTLAELKALRDHGDRLAADDLYSAHATGLTRSVLLNDTRQVRYFNDNGNNVTPVYRALEIDTDFDENSEGFVAPSKGTVEWYADGTFMYTPNFNASGTDRFTYRAKCDISPDGSGDFAFSAPAWVRVIIGEPTCDADYNNSGQVNLIDLQSLVDDIDDDRNRADFDDSGATDFFDLISFLKDYDEDC